MSKTTATNLTIAMPNRFLPIRSFDMQQTRLALVAITLPAFCFLATGCGYQHSGSFDNAAKGYKWQTLYRDDVKTVAVPIFTNRTFYRGVEFSLTKAVVSQLEGQSPYKVIAKEQADTVLEGEIERVRVHTTSNDRITTLPQDQLYVITVNFRWRDLRTGKIFVDRKRFEQSAPYYPTLGEDQFVGDQLAVERLALAIVQEMQSDWGVER